jgi:hypothetical protein
MRKASQRTSFLCDTTYLSRSHTAGTMNTRSVRRASGFVQVGFEEIATDLPRNQL